MQPHLYEWRGPAVAAESGAGSFTQVQGSGLWGAAVSPQQRPPTPMHGQGGDTQCESLRDGQGSKPEEGRGTAPSPPRLSEQLVQSLMAHGMTPPQSHVAPLVVLAG
jgi:hypothetical protein